ncbi:MAG: DNA ligase-associated DEXH box helicase [unclassified Hahellaceae]|nr:DNA ligase-associated DEXH box helicase [Hahellaceae bacterium]|tara:strand:- start:8462 stop:10966 length:2505 start_codon:yes stop_codon:yes gene_type:complete
MLPSAIEAWFDARGWRPAAFQLETAEAFTAGRSGLLHAPTGSGKTVAALLGPLSKALDEGQAGGRIQILWVTPLRALATDTTNAIRTMVAELLPDWQVMKRSADTSASERQKIRRRLPEVLVTTPESLSLLLSYPDSQQQFSSLQVCVVDEWHELLGSKRGVQLQLALARLQTLAPQMRRWGLSATLGNLDEALEVLCHGLPAARGGAPLRIEGDAVKQVEIDTLIPARIERFPWAGHLGLSQLDGVLARIESAQSTLVFTNTRSQAELWYEAIIKARLDWLTVTAVHHGSLSRKVRGQIEDGLRSGYFKCVVCTSSLDLGVDFSPVEQVIQIGSPKGVARLSQRAGRSGHQPGSTSRILCVPSHAFELLEALAAREAVQLGNIEKRPPLRLCLDVLVQHLVTLALSKALIPDVILAEVRRTHAFAGLSDQAWQWALDFISRGGNALQHYDEFSKVAPGEAPDEPWSVPSRRIALRHRMAIGTITSDAEISVKLIKGRRLGQVEESFIAKLTPGDGFLFAGRVLEFVRLKDMVAEVRLARKKGRIIPRWSGSKMPLSTQLADGVISWMGRVSQALESGGADPRDLTQAVKALEDFPREILALESLLRTQQRLSALPAPGRLLVEAVRTREGTHCYIYPFAGRLVHEGLAAIIGYRLTRRTPITFKMTVNDYGIELLTARALPFDEASLKDLFSIEQLDDDLLASINSSEFAKRQFRDIARIAGLVFGGYPGAAKSNRGLQMSTGVLFDVLREYDPENELIKQAFREVLHEQMEYERLQSVMLKLQDMQVELQTPGRLTPLAFPLWAQRIREQVVSSEQWQDRLERMLESLYKGL